jgi:NDP-sugar pyrophosphorylase family protein
VFCAAAGKHSVSVSNQTVKTSKSRKFNIAEFPAVLLVGGLGKRLQSVVSTVPKPLARLGNVPFLQLLVLQLRSQGIRRMVMCTGHLGGQIEEEFGDGRNFGVSIEYSREASPLGTAGALKFAERHLEQDLRFLLMNGDSFLEMDFNQFAQFHSAHGGPISMAVRKVPNAARYGTVKLDAEGRLKSLIEKTGIEGPGLVNGGVYIFNHEVLDRIPDGPSSLELDVLPRMLTEGVWASDQNGMFIDIGTPEDYARAADLYDRLHDAATAGSCQRASKDRS